MVTTAETPSESKIIKEELRSYAFAAGYEASRATRTLLTGNGNGRVRRNLLFILTAAGVLLGLPLLALLPLLLLALTDMVTE